MVKGGILKKQDFDLTLDFNQPSKRSFKNRRKAFDDKNFHNQSNQIGPDLTATLALTTPELEDKILSDFGSQPYDLIGLTPTTTHTILSPQSLASSNDINGASSIAATSSGNTHTVNTLTTPTSTTTTTATTSPATPNTDMERHLKQFQSLQTPLFDPIRDIMGLSSIASAPTSAPDATSDSGLSHKIYSTTSNTTATTTTAITSQIRRPSPSASDDQSSEGQQNVVGCGVTKEKKMASKVGVNSDSCLTSSHLNRSNQDLQDEQMMDDDDSDGCKSEGEPLLPTTLISLNADNTSTGHTDIHNLMRQSNIFTQSTLSSDNVSDHHQQQQHFHHHSSVYNDADDNHNNIPLTVRRISEQSSSMDSTSYSPQLASLLPNNNNANQQEQHPYLVFVRSPNQQLTNTSGSVGSVVTDQDKLKIDRKRARNREAASKCRKRKIERISQLEKQVEELEKRLKEATSELDRHRKAGCHTGGGCANNRQMQY